VLVFRGATDKGVGSRVSFMVQGLRYWGRILDLELMVQGVGGRVWDVALTVKGRNLLGE